MICYVDAYSGIDLNETGLTWPATMIDRISCFCMSARIYFETGYPKQPDPDAEADSLWNEWRRNG